MRNSWLIWMTTILLSITVIILCRALRETRINRQRIGEKVVMFGDTLTIEDYNESYGYYILSNGLIMK